MKWNTLFREVSFLPSCRIHGLHPVCLYSFPVINNMVTQMPLALVQSFERFSEYPRPLGTLDTYRHMRLLIKVRLIGCWNVGACQTWPHICSVMPVIISTEGCQTTCWLATSIWHLHRKKPIFHTYQLLHWLVQDKSSAALLVMIDQQNDCLHRNQISAEP